MDGIYAQSESARHSSIAANKGTNYGVVRINLLERIYEQLYAQRIRYDNEEDWPHRILKVIEAASSSLEDLRLMADGKLYSISHLIQLTTWTHSRYPLWVWQQPPSP